MAVVRLTTEGNADGAAVTAAATGASQLTNSTGSMEFDTSTAGVGAVSIQINPAASGANYLQQNLTATNNLGLDMLVKFDTAVTVAMSMLWVGVGNTRSLAAGVSSTMKLTILDSAAATIYTSTGTVPTGEWVRLSLVATPGAGTGTARFAAFSGQSSTPITGCDSGLLTGRSFNAGGFTTAHWGKASTSNTATVFRIDEPSYDTAATDLIPPQAVTAPALTATASSTLGVGVTNATGAPGGRGAATATISLNAISATPIAGSTSTAAGGVTLAGYAPASGATNTIGWYGGNRVIDLRYNGQPVVGVSLGTTPLF